MYTLMLSIEKYTLWFLQVLCTLHQPHVHQLGHDLPSSSVAVAQQRQQSLHDIWNWKRESTYNTDAIRWRRCPLDKGQEAERTNPQSHGAPRTASATPPPPLRSTPASFPLWCTQQSSIRNELQLLFLNIVVKKPD